MNRPLRLFRHFLLYGSLGFAGLNLVAASGRQIFPLTLGWLLSACMPVSGWRSPPPGPMAGSCR